MKPLNKPFICGIAGDSGVGKSTLTGLLIDIIGKRLIVVLNGDDMHKWERGHKNWQIFTPLNPRSNKIHLDYEQLYALRKGEMIERVRYSHKTGRFTRPVKIAPNKFIVLQGLHPFQDRKSTRLNSSHRL